MTTQPAARCSISQLLAYKEPLFMTQANVTWDSLQQTEVAQFAVTGAAVITQSALVTLIRRGRYKPRADCVAWLSMEPQSAGDAGQATVDRVATAGFGGTING